MNKHEFIPVDLLNTLRSKFRTMSFPSIFSTKPKSNPVQITLQTERKWRKVHKISCASNQLGPVYHKKNGCMNITLTARSIHLKSKPPRNISLAFPSEKANVFSRNCFLSTQVTSNIKYKYLHRSHQNQFKTFREIPKITKHPVSYLNTLIHNKKLLINVPRLPIEYKTSYFENARLTPWSSEGT